MLTIIVSIRTPLPNVTRYTIIHAIEKGVEDLFLLKKKHALQ